MTLVEIRRIIRQRRNNTGLTQEGFARASGIARRTLTRLESGDPAVRIGTIEKAARALGLSLTVQNAGLNGPTLGELDALYLDDSCNTILRSGLTRGAGSKT
jgi:transcriptional regulator with XRE-family HTH domain